MKKSAVFLVACLLWLGVRSDARAQVAYVTYYQPMTVYSPPVVVTPQTVYYTPQTVYYTPQTVYYTPQTVYYTPAPAVSYQPVARVRTRYRPILGGSVTRVRYRYAPVYHTAMPVVYAY
ncbi:MAG: hypothetical protein IH898_07005 [Planctomycetes bacterium]|nr:hypothetical protein [Planctomycetota bacterium]